MKPRLKYNPLGYLRLSEIVGWLAAGKNVQIRGNRARSWVSFDASMGSVEMLLNGGCYFRVKP